MLLQQNPAGKRFFHSLDGVRGIASILVVLFHIGPYFGSVKFQESYLAVDVFFALSGVVISHTYEQRLRTGMSVGQFAWIRIVRIYPLYFLGTVLMLATLLGLYSEYTGRQILLLSGLAAVVLPNPGIGTQAFFPLDIPAWSLFLELAVNIFYAAALRYLTARTIVLIMVLSALGMIGSVVKIEPHALSMGWRSVGWRGIGMICGMCRVGYSFFAGVLLYRLFSRAPHSAMKSSIAGALPWGILVAVALLLMSSPPDAVRPYYDLFAVMVVFPAIIYLALGVQPQGFGARICQFMGALSYAVYAIHYPLSILVQDLLRLSGAGPVSRYAPWIGFAFLAVLFPLCWLICRLYDAPVRRYLMRWQQRKAVTLLESA